MRHSKCANTFCAPPLFISVPFFFPPITRAWTFSRHDKTLVDDSRQINVIVSQVLRVYLHFTLNVLEQILFCFEYLWDNGKPLPRFARVACLAEEYFAHFTIIPHFFVVECDEIIQEKKEARLLDSNYAPIENNKITNKVRAIIACCIIEDCRVHALLARSCNIN